MLRTLDRYIIRKFLMHFFYALMLFIIIAIVIDLTEKIDDFLDNPRLSFSIVVFEYYIYFIPYIAALLSHIFIFLSVMFFTSKMSYNTEFVAMLSGGVNFYRLLVPYMIAAAILAGLLFYANNWLVPHANLQRQNFEYKYIKNDGGFRDNHAMKVTDGEYIIVQRYVVKNATATNFIYDQWKADTLKRSIDANPVVWQPGDSSWNLMNFREVDFIGDSMHIQQGSRKDTVLQLKPEDIENRESRKSELTTPELRKLIAQLKAQGGQNVSTYEVELHRRSSDAFAVFILTLIAFAVASSKNNVGIYILAGIVFSALYVVSMQFSTTFSISGNVPPVIGTWTPNVVFLIVGIFLLRFSRK